MKRVIILGLAVLAISLTSTLVSAGGGIRQQDRDRDRVCDPICDPAVCPNCPAADLNGDGICDNCGTCIPKGPDADGDGIPNGQDPDYVPPQDGSGKP